MRIQAVSMWLTLSVAALLLAPAASGVEIDWVIVGNPGNAANTDPSDFPLGCGTLRNKPCGAVAYPYQIGKYEVTNEQYAEFLNANAAADTLGLYTTNMETAPFGGITRSGSYGTYTYTVKPGFAERPVVYVSFYSALRFANWLNNGQGTGSTETGAYTLLGGFPTPTNGKTVTRNAGASIFLTSEDEWYKAAYYDPVAGLYYEYPAGFDGTISCTVPGATANSANCFSAVGIFVNVGSYTGSASPYGTFDQGGNVHEWNETFYGDGSIRSLRGGAFDNIPSNLGASAHLGGGNADRVADYTLGFRVMQCFETLPGIYSPCSPRDVPLGDVAAPLVAGLLLMTGLLGLAYRERRHRCAPRCSQARSM